MAVAVATLRTRVGLLATELEEEKLRLSAILLFGGMAVSFLLFTLLLLVLFLTALFWEQRLWVLGIAIFIFLAAGIFAFLRVAAELGRPSQLFSSSLAELKKDWQALRREGDE